MRTQLLFAFAPVILVLFAISAAIWWSRHDESNGEQEEVTALTAAAGPSP